MGDTRPYGRGAERSDLHPLRSAFDALDKSSSEVLDGERGEGERG